MKIYKPATKPLNCPLEETEQITFVNWLSTNHPQHRMLMTHAKNEGKRTKIQADKDRAMGMNKGTSDIIIIHRIPFICELKRSDPSKGRPSKEQLQYLQAAHQAGAFACLCYGHEQVIRAFNDWLRVIS